MTTFGSQLESLRRFDWQLSLTRNALLVVTGSLVLTLSARIQLPMWPVPMTLQDLAVLLVGATMGSRLGAAAVATYLAQGAVGLPVFAREPYGGLAYFTGPTGGYLVGFVVAAFIVGLLAERGWLRRWPTAALACAIGQLVIFHCGFGWLAVLSGPAVAFISGVQPFLVGGLVKVLAATALIRTVGPK